MINMNEIEVTSINKFLEKFTFPVVKVFSNELDKEVFKSFEFILNSSEQDPNINILKEDNAVYELDYVIGGDSSKLAVFIPEKLIATITDVKMGGSGEDSYKGSLSELEINAFAELLPKIFKDIENIFIKFYEENLAFDADPLFLAKSNAVEYENQIHSMLYDYAVNYTFRINSKDDYKVILLLNKNDARKLIQEFKISADGEISKKANIDSVTLQHLSDIKIDISAELGKAKVPVKYALELTKGSMVTLDTFSDEDIKVFANGVEVAEAQIVVVGESFGLRITKIVSTEERMKAI